MTTVQADEKRRMLKKKQTERELPASNRALSDGSVGAPCDAGACAMIPRLDHLNIQDEQDSPVRGSQPIFRKRILPIQSHSPQIRKNASVSPELFSFALAVDLANTPSDEGA